ncbi:glycosyltransferase [Fulvivirga lutimaris]|uniref:glycosyltransferase n=1 Tax=Fulvivirga lutimaris TaxID=1819566 RepID=UPI0012BC4669|nr:glycosyltransferase [Fulvivirga lutimaris]MTI38252.1 glycosyltransferase family 1 protein [Fulvivirga lutimaris]
MKIIIGVHELANNVFSMHKALKKHGYDIESVVLKNQVKNHKFYSSNSYDHELETSSLFQTNKLLNKVAIILTKTLFFIKSLFKYDVFVYITDVTLLPLHMDWPILNLLNKRIIIFNCGSEVRQRQVQYMIDSNVYNFELFDGDTEQLKLYYQKGRSFQQTLRTQAWEEMFCDDIVSIRNQSTFQNKPCYVFKFPVEEIRNKVKLPNKIPLIIHAPSDRIFKGTKYVLEAIEMLKSSGATFHFELIENKPNDYVLERLNEADILIDQPGSWVARLAIEAMAASCATIGGNMQEYIDFEAPSPVIQFETDSKKLYEKLNKLVSDIDYRKQKMSECYDFWKDHYSEEAYSNFFRKILDKTAHQYQPIKNNRNLLLNFSETKWQRIAIKLLIKKRSSYKK